MSTPHTSREVTVVGVIFTKCHRRYPLKKFGNWLEVAAGVKPSTVPVYVSCVRQVLAAVEGEYANEEKVRGYIASLVGSKYHSTVAAWRRFTEYLATQGKQGARLPAKEARRSAGDQDPAVAALHEVYRWLRARGKSARDLVSLYFVERAIDGWTVGFGGPDRLAHCPGVLTLALDLLRSRAKAPENLVGYRVWPMTPGENDECPLTKIRGLLRIDHHEAENGFLVRRGATESQPPDSLENAAEGAGAFTPDWESPR